MTVKPIKPGPDEYMYTSAEFSTAPPPVDTVLIPPAAQPDDPLPPKNFLHPKAGIFTLKKNECIPTATIIACCEWSHLPNCPQPSLMAIKVPECVQMVPGVPFAFEIEGKPDDLHTIGAVHTFESLRHEPDFWPILEDTILVAKGLRGCRPVGNTDEVFPITHYPIKTNDRSPANVAEGSKQGVTTSPARSSRETAQELYYPLPRSILPNLLLRTLLFCSVSAVCGDGFFRKTVSKYEYETTEWNSEDMNVVGFGGLEPNNATTLLSKALGFTGSPHPDVKDDEPRRTYFLLLLSLPPGSDAGAFLLARAGIYIRELNTWAIHMFFDGTDIHTGIGATTTLSVPEFQAWIQSSGLEAAWKLSELGRIGVVQYAMLGNYAPEASVKLRDFATHGQEILGGQEPWANRMGREIVYNFWNQLQLCNLDLGVDVGEILQSITFKNRAGEQVPLKPLPFHPVKDAEMIALKRSHYEYLRQRCKRMRIYIEKHQFLQFRERLRNEDYDPTEDLNAFGGHRSPRPGGENPRANSHPWVKSVTRVLTDDTDQTLRYIQQNDPRLPDAMVPIEEDIEMPDVTPRPETFSSTGANAGSQVMQHPDPDTGHTLNSPSASDSSCNDSPSGSQRPNISSTAESSSAAENLNPLLAPSQGTRSKVGKKQVEIDHSEDEQEYDLEKIIRLEQDNRGKWYLCKFVGYDNHEWVHENDLSTGCEALLKTFYQSLAAGSDHEELSSEESDDSNASQEASQPPSKKRKLAKSKQGIAKSGRVAAPPAIGSTQHLEVLLNPDRLLIEIA
ncbi:hypothetical protein B0H14DRAFT_3696359 [Mycena olivaceomarginata]|nr:hypothetical protein B0H14DRAFT_3696359 [Mycena olivaceomarginata]